MRLFLQKMMYCGYKEGYVLRVGEEQLVRIEGYVFMQN